ncbi:hypothetical protein SAMN04488543_2512 [Friedmanniella luteola]|uniref:Uncharacterized protein n=1 Tax=Friedmanniella luteola TaxID=546871 RepID=A0A1H1VL14_9ACTN|nr:hypothetical protein [Friedmanniella luteola]SDS85051.1 hypothetical protein SAMN04488543_2512 [Friedmanniella luteola]
MESTTTTRTREIALLSRVLEAGNGWRAAADQRGRGDICVLSAKPSFQGGAIAVFDMAAVTPVVTDHTYSTRPGSPSCSPPV